MAGGDEVGGGGEKGEGGEFGGLRRREKKNKEECGAGFWIRALCSWVLFLYGVPLVSLSKVGIDTIQSRAEQSAKKPKIHPKELTGQGLFERRVVIISLLGQMGLGRNNLGLLCGAHQRRTLHSTPRLFGYSSLSQKKTKKKRSPPRTNLDDSLGNHDS